MKRDDEGAQAGANAAGDRPRPALGGAFAAAQATRERLRANAANARAERERARAREAISRALAAEARLAAIEASAAWRLTWPVRRLAHAVPSPVYRLIRGLPADLPRASTGTAPPCAPAVSPPTASSPVARLPIALLIDDHWPRPDRDSGSIDIVNLADSLIALGFEVRFAADRDGADVPGGWAGRDALAARGIHCLSAADARSVPDYLEQEGGALDLVVLNRVYAGGRFLEDVRRHCTGAQVVFNTIDLHYVRIRREAELRGDAAGLAVARATREREEALARAADMTLVVSAAERDALVAAVPGAVVVVLPLARELRPPRAPFEVRTGIGFIGGFAHAPNVDAVRYFLSEVWPLVLRGAPGMAFSIVGADMPEGLLDGAPGAVRYLGPVEDATPWFESLRLTVAPLRYGAGLKGKVVSSLAAGVPCVSTPLAVEGMDVGEGEGVLVADTPDGLAACILRAHTDAGLWAEVSARGLAHAAKRYSPAAWRRTVEEALWVLDVPAGVTAPGPHAGGAA